MKYLFLSTTGWSARNIDQALNVLRGAIREAIHLNRTLVLGTFNIDATGNFGQALENLNYEQFIDLNKTQICRITRSDITELKESFSYVNEKDFDLKIYSDSEVLFAEGGQAITVEQNQLYKVVVRKIIISKYADNYPDILVRFFPSNEVDRLSDIVFKKWGTSLEDLKRLSTIRYGTDYSVNMDSYKIRYPYHPGYYICIHIQQNNSTTPQNLYETSPRQIESILRHRKRIIYIISDISIPNYFDFLKKNRIVYQYHDFPELNALVSGQNGQIINSALLYSVEKNILSYAYIKIISFKDLSGLPIVYSNCSDKIPWRYKLLAHYKSLFQFMPRFNFH